MIINTNINALVGINNLRKTGQGLQGQLEKLSSGLRINKGADDPSGLAIAKHMEAQINGIRTAIQNAEDGISLIHTADGALAQTQDVLMRMRDLAVRGSNEATLTTSDLGRLNDEVEKLKDSIRMKSSNITFNTKKLFSGEFASGQFLQVGPDNDAYFRLSVRISAVTLSVLGISAVNVASLAAAQSAIGLINNAINITSNMRASLGITERLLGHIIDDIKTADINISAAKSRISDCDMGVEITEFTRLQILQQTGTAILGQANALPQSVLKLIG